MLRIPLQAYIPHPFIRFPLFSLAHAVAGCTARNRRT